MSYTYSSFREVPPSVRTIVSAGWELWLNKNKNWSMLASLEVMSQEEVDALKTALRVEGIHFKERYNRTYGQHLKVVSPLRRPMEQSKYLWFSPKDEATGDDLDKIRLMIQGILRINRTDWIIDQQPDKNSLTLLLPNSTSEDVQLFIKALNTCNLKAASCETPRGIMMEVLPDETEKRVLINTLFEILEFKVSRSQALQAAPLCAPVKARLQRPPEGQAFRTVPRPTTPSTP